MKKCVAVLVNSASDYMSLIQRNLHVDLCLKDKEHTDILIFHEGNITNVQQKEISAQTPELCLQYINVRDGNKAFRQEKEDVLVRAAYSFNINFRHQSSFWFIDFWKFLGSYDLVIRIDNDCCIDFDLDWAFETLRTTCLLTGKEIEEDEFMVLGLNEYTISFLHQNKRFANTHKRHPITGPCTHVFGINISNLKRNITLRKFVENIDKSDKIYSHRWDDIALWGETVQYILSRSMMRVDSRIQYHSSFQA